MSDHERDEEKHSGCLIPLFSFLIFGFVVLGVIVFFFGTVKVNPTELGVRTVHFDIPGFYTKGVQKEVLDPGYHFFLPFIMEIDVFDATVKTYHMSKHFSGSPEQGGEALEIRTRDESTVTVDAMVLYQVDREFAYVYWQNVGKSNQQVSRLSTKVRDGLKLALGQLGRDEFYSNAKGREARANQVVEEINRVFDRKVVQNGTVTIDPEAEGIHVIDILISDFAFTEEYESKIRDKSLAEEEETVQVARQKAEEQRAFLTEIKAKGEAAYNIIVEEGQAEARKIRAEADMLYNQKIAQGDLLIKLAEAEGKKALNQAFTGRGGKVSAALEYAKALKGLQTIILDSAGKNGINPMDRKRMLELYDVE